VPRLSCSTARRPAGAGEELAFLGHPAQRLRFSSICDELNAMEDIGPRDACFVAAVGRANRPTKNSTFMTALALEVALRFDVAPPERANIYICGERQAEWEGCRTHASSDSVPVRWRVSHRTSRNLRLGELQKKKGRFQQTVY